MALENEVAALVTSTTALQNEVGSQLAKVRSENATFKTTVVAGVASSKDSSLVLFDGTTGKQIKSANATLDVMGNGLFNGVGVASTSSGNSLLLLLTNNTSFLGANTTAPHNTVIGTGGNFFTNTSGGYNVGVGIALNNNTTGAQNTAIGVLSLNNNTTGGNNAATGMYALQDNTIGAGNVAMGCLALKANTTGNYNTAIGFNSLSQGDLTNCTGVGSGSLVSTNNQVQLGDSATTTFVYGTVQNRSDARDKADIRPTVLGLEFIKALRPVDYRWDMRDYYRLPMPTPLLPDVSSEERSAYDASIIDWQKSNKLANIVPDGSQKKKRYHHGVIAQEVADLIKSTGVDFGGLQDHSRSGGDSVLSIGYDELIAPLIKAVQELAQANEDLRSRITVLEAGK